MGEEHQAELERQEMLVEALRRIQGFIKYTLSDLEGLKVAVADIQLIAAALGLSEHFKD